jgi:hypothetical protein
LIDQLYQLVSAAVTQAGFPWQVVFANQNIPRLVKPYVQLNVTTVDVPDHLYYTLPDDEGIVTTSGWRKATVEMQVFNGINSLNTISRLAMMLQSTAMLDKQAELDCSIGQRLFMGYVPELLNNSQYEGRGIYHFEFFYTESLSEKVDTIDIIETHGQFIGTHSDADPYVIFDPNPLNVDIICDEEIFGPDADGTGTDWDDGNTGWDKDDITGWDDQLYLGPEIDWDDDTTTWDDNTVTWHDEFHNG